MRIIFKSLSFAMASWKSCINDKGHLKKAATDGKETGQENGEHIAQAQYIHKRIDKRARHSANVQEPNGVAEIGEYGETVSLATRDCTGWFDTIEQRQRQNQAMIDWRHGLRIVRFDPYRVDHLTIVVLVSI